MRREAVPRPPKPELTIVSSPPFLLTWLLLHDHVVRLEDGRGHVTHGEDLRRQLAQEPEPHRVPEGPEHVRGDIFSYLRMHAPIVAVPPGSLHLWLTCPFRTHRGVCADPRRTALLRLLSMQGCAAIG